MRGDIAFAGFMMTADEWQELDSESRAQLIAVATRRADPWLGEPRPRRFPDGTGKHEVVEALDGELDELIEPIDDAELAQLGLECEIEAAIEVAALGECASPVSVESAIDAGWFEDAAVQDSAAVMPESAIPIAALDTPLARAVLDASAPIVTKLVIEPTIAPKRRARRTTAKRTPAAAQATIDNDALEQWLAFQPVCDATVDHDEWPELPAATLPAVATLPSEVAAAPEFEDFADWADL